MEELLSWKHARAVIWTPQDYLVRLKCLYTLSFAVSSHILRWCLNIEGVYVKGVRITWNCLFLKKGGIFEDNEPFVVPTLASILKLKKHGCLYIANESKLT